MSDPDPGSPLEQSGQAADEGFGSEDSSGHTNCPEKYWVAVRLIGEDKEPLPGQAYKVELPDGKVAEGKLDENGLAMVESDAEGSCIVTFPDLHKESWEPA